MIIAKIDVTKIDKARIFVGKKGKYIDICLIETPNDKYGNAYMVTQSVSQEERNQGVKGNILGNAKIIGKPATPPATAAPKPAAPTAPPAPDAPPPPEEDDVPF